MMTTQPRRFFGPRVRHIALTAITVALSSATLSAVAFSDQARHAPAGSPVHPGKACYAALGHLPEWQPRRGESLVPTSWALLGDLLFTESGCAVFLCGEVAGLPGIGQGPTNRTGWRWSGRCSKGLAEGSGTAELILRSGETRPGLLGNGFAQATLRNARMEGLFQATDESRDDPSWRDHFDRYANGRVVERLQRRENGALVPITYRETENGWMWVDAGPAKESDL